MYRKIDTANCNYSLGNKQIALPKVNYVKDSSDIYTDPPVGSSEQSQMLASLNYRFNDLCDFLGIPQRIYQIAFCNSPATIDGTSLQGTIYRGYLVNLVPVRNNFSYVLFHAQDGPEDSNIVRGLIIDDEGNIECYTTDTNEHQNDYTKLPVTENSAWLWATCPMKGIDKFPVMPDYVQVFNPALLHEMQLGIDQLNYLAHSINREAFLDSIVCSDMVNRL